MSVSLLGVTRESVMPARQPARLFLPGWTATLACMCLVPMLSAERARSAQLQSPNGELALEVALAPNGGLEYQLFRRGAAVIRQSPLGVRLSGTAFLDDLVLVSTSPATMVTDSYALWTGKGRQFDYTASEFALKLENRDGHEMRVTMRLSDDGLAYRYEFQSLPGGPQTIESEFSGVRFFPETRAWLQPKAVAQSGWKNTNPSYEEDYLQDIAVGTPSPFASGWVYPALFHYRDCWIVLSETGMDGHYPGSSLGQHSDDGLYRLAFPQDAEVVTGGPRLAIVENQIHSPWRLVLIGDLETVMQSTLGTDLADPTVVDDANFVEPGIAAWSWGIEKDESVVYPVQKKYVDFAARMHWPYVLVDADWDRNIGYEEIGKLAKYAARKDVGLLLWYNSSGGWNETVYSPKSRLLTRADRRTEFGRLERMGIRGVKIDFFPGDGASVMQYYRDILRDAAEFRLMVTFHGSTLPRGLQRTFPNLVTSEAVKGLEFITFLQETADREATHVAMLPFTRNLFDPMDFTPTVLGKIPGIERRTSNAFQLALPILFISGVQHIVTTPDQMRRMPKFVREYLREVPGRWDESRFIDGFPGQFVTIARRSGRRWYVAGINAQESRRMDLDLRFTGARQGMLIVDADEPGELQMETIRAGRQSLTLAAGTGFVMLFDSKTED